MGQGQQPQLQALPLPRLGARIHLACRGMRAGAGSGVTGRCVGRVSSPGRPPPATPPGGRQLSGGNPSRTSGPPRTADPMPCRDIGVTVSRTATISRDTCIGDGSSVGEATRIQVRRACCPLLAAPALLVQHASARGPARNSAWPCAVWQPAKCARRSSSPSGQPATAAGHMRSALQPARELPPLSSPCLVPPPQQQLGCQTSTVRSTVGAHTPGIPRFCNSLCCCCRRRRAAPPCRTASSARAAASARTWSCVDATCMMG